MIARGRGIHEARGRHSPVGGPHLRKGLFEKHDPKFVPVGLRESRRSARVVHRDAIVDDQGDPLLLANVIESEAVDPTRFDVLRDEELADDLGVRLGRLGSEASGEAFFLTFRHPLELHSDGIPTTPLERVVHSCHLVERQLQRASLLSSFLRSLGGVADPFDRHSLEAKWQRSTLLPPRRLPTRSRSGASSRQGRPA